MRIVTGVMRAVQVRAGSVYDLGCHIVLCPKCRRPVLAGRCEKLIGARTSGHGWRMGALGIMPGHGHLFVKAHLPGNPSQIVSPFKGLTSERLRAGCLHLRCRLAWWSRSYCAAAAGAVPAQAVYGCIGTQAKRLWRKERPR
jgi:REP-associated tyrosine transposase